MSTKKMTSSRNYPHKRRVANTSNWARVPILKEEKMAGTLEEIDSWMRHIWLKVIKAEYDQSRILEESNLHSTVYFHLRKLIES
jgi:hypothetical protein